MSQSALTTALYFGDLVVGAVPITGTPYNDSMGGRDGNDHFIPAGGNDRVSGGGGEDTVSLSGSSADYTFTVDGAVVTVSGPDGRDTIDNIERFIFTGSGEQLTFAEISARATR